MYDATSNFQVTDNDISQFSAMLPSIIDQLTNNKTLGEIPEVADRYKMVSVNFYYRYLLNRLTIKISTY